MPHNAVLIRKLETNFSLDREEVDAIAAILFHIRSYTARYDIVLERDRPSQCCLLLEGIACRYKIVAGGRRQIFSFHLPGDVPDLHSLHLDTMDHCLATVTIGLIPHATLREFMRTNPRIAEVFWRDTLIEASIFRAWMAGLGARGAYVRVAHFFCEMVTRLRALDLVERAACTVPMPLTQTIMAEALGLTPVHINRTLGALRENGLLTIVDGQMVILDWDRLQVGEFDPTYLHLRTTKMLN